MCYIVSAAGTSVLLLEESVWVHYVILQVIRTGWFWWSGGHCDPYHCVNWTYKCKVHSVTIEAREKQNWFQPVLSTCIYTSCYTSRYRLGLPCFFCQFNFNTVDFYIGLNIFFFHFYIVRHTSYFYLRKHYFQTKTQNKGVLNYKAYINVQRIHYLDMKGVIF
jgi:hypothetical protein